MIVADDYSTDSSCAVVESYVPKFNGRLKLTTLKKHSGGATEPRNLGLSFSRGEYLYFLDSDDTITPTALEELYTLAKKFDADVVQCEKMYGIPEKFYHDAEYKKNLQPSAWPADKKFFIKEPTLLTENFAQRAVEFCKRWLTWSIWIQLIRRDFILENNLRFDGLICEDLLFTICEICSAKRYLVVPNVIYLHRNRQGSFLWRDGQDVGKLLSSRLISIKNGVRYLDKYLSRFETFARRPDLKYLLFDMYTKDLTDHLRAVYAHIPAPAFDEFLRREFSNGDNVALTAYIFSTMNIQKLQLIQAQQYIAEMESKLKQLKSKE